MQNKKYKLSLLAAAIALPITALSINAQTIIKEEQRFIVTFKQASSLKDQKDPITQSYRTNALFDTAAAKIDAQIVKRLPSANAMALILTVEQKTALENDASVQSIEVDPKRYLAAESTPYGITMVQAQQLSDSGSVNQKVCIMDTGYDLGHEDLPLSWVSGSDGYASYNSGNWDEDGHGHGTHVSGIIAALGNNVVGVVGVNPNNNLKKPDNRWNVGDDDGKKPSVQAVG